MKKREAYYRKLFLIGSIYNTIAGLSFFIFYKMVFSIVGMEPPLYPAVLQSFTIVILVLGYGYFTVYKDLGKNRPIVVMGILAKSLCCFVFMYHFFFGNITLPLLSLLIIDLLFALLFLEFLLRYESQ